ncbi:MAG: rhomboid family intramembrane serine protease [Ignavibacteriales bacterium]|nr:rhomboid family intramembrane serine protease [Ignavibacteriales bacterium]
MANNYYRPGGFGGFSFFPPVIKNLMIINAAVFFLQMVMRNILVSGVPAYSVILQYFALMPIDSGHFQLWQPITYQFLHGSFSHILFNMFSLWMFGIEIENYWGSKKFLIFYLLCGVGGGLAQLLFSPLINGIGAPTIGASGAIFGVMLAFGLLYPDRYIYIYFFIPVKAKYLILGMILLNIFGLGDDGSGVAYLAHIGGGVTGLIYMLMDKNTTFSFSSIFGIKQGGGNPFKDFTSSSGSRQSFFQPKPREEEPPVQDANYYDVKEDDVITQEEIDRILDKISQFGYKGLTEREKKILFEASKRMK